ncbi:transcription factor cwo [Anopheles ziemanni]|uniref:transcription factor cwo n=1 Tax=Anopheles coustani TaxID=139045 RepID=UPI00265B6572|nr:transcription factor cwo [Anopheles coustani]XP_058172312.1 transcription factor cwo [Anopheles ziemanni]
MEGYWEAANGHGPHSLKYESEASVPGYTYCGEPGLNFSTNNNTYSEDDADFPPGRRGKTSRQDPLSHRIIEKRRRDRMNSCLADLSRLIPQQYMRKGRGRVEKTEIIEMAIRHLKNLQNQECGRETSCGEQYRLGYNDCLTEAAKFMLRERGEEMCYRMVAHLKEHCNEIMKGEMIKSRCGVEMANGGSPIYLANGPIGQHLREMLTCPSDLEHSSNDHHDVKDLSFRSATSSSSINSSNNPPQAAVITSTAPSVQHLDTSSNHSTQDYDAPSPPRIVGGLQQDTNNNINHQHESVLRTIRSRNLSEHASPEHEHSHNSYKFKNYIQQRFSQDTHENGHSIDHLDRSPGSAHGDDHHHHHLQQSQPSLRASPMTNGSSTSSGSLCSAPESKTSSTVTMKSSTVASSSDEPLSLKRKLPPTSSELASISSNSGGHLVDAHQSQQLMAVAESVHPLEKKLALAKNGLTVAASSAAVPLPATEIKHELMAAGSGAGGVLTLGASATPAFAHQQQHQQQQQQQQQHHHHHSSYHPVPIFACHTQGFYVPLNVDYETLLPYLNGIDLLSKGFLQLPPLHPISISVNYSPATIGVGNPASGASLLMKATVNGLHPQTKTKLVEGIISGC